jgi:hypothetical protein
MASQTSSGLELHLHDNTSGEHAVHASVLARVLLGLQDAVNSLAQDKKVDPSTARSRARISPTLADEYSLVCGVPQAGSYFVPLSLSHVDLLADFREKEVTDHLITLAEAVQTGDMDSLRGMFQHNVFRCRALEAVRRASPESEDTWHTEIRGGSRFIELDQRTHASIDRLVAELASVEEDVEVTMTGVVEMIDVHKKESAIKHGETGHRLRFGYTDDIEELLVANLGKLVEITANVHLDSDGRPTEIEEIFSIQEVDMSPVVLDRIQFGEGFLAFRPVIQLTPAESTPTHLLRLEHPPLDIDVFARTRDDLLDELNEQVVMLWTEYAKEDDRNLTASSRDLKQKLLAAIEEVPSAPSEE